MPLRYQVRWSYKALTAADSAHAVRALDHRVAGACDCAISTLTAHRLQSKP
jgi:hypothetical protein